MDRKKKSRARSLIKKSGAIKKGYFKLTSGRYSEIYIDPDEIYLRPQILSELAKMIAEENAEFAVEGVVGPADGGNYLAQWVVYWLNELKKGWSDTKAVALQTRKIKKGTKREFEIVPKHQKLVEGRKVLIVDDILSTGGSMRKVAKELRRLKCGLNLGAFVIWNRRGKPYDEIGFDICALDVRCLIHDKIPSWKRSECPKYILKKFTEFYTRAKK